MLSNEFELGDCSDWINRQQVKNNNKDKRKQEMESCDTFVVMSDLTTSGDVIFGKNSDRPVGEVQEVVRIPAKNYQEEITLQVSTY